MRSPSPLAHLLHDGHIGSVNWHRLFPDDDFRFHMGLRPGNAAAFFGAPADPAVLAQRREIIRSSAAECVLTSGSAAESEALALLSSYAGIPLTDPAAAGGVCESDFVILAPDSTGTPVVTGGVVCFPSSWSLREKAGLPLSGVHAPVPGLNPAMARQIDTFLSRLGPGVTWERDNWGMSADDALDHHPRHPHPGLTATATLDKSWLRLERQILVGLTGGAVLFGIHVSVHRLDSLAAVAGLAPRIARALATMAPEIAAYKGLTAARETLATQLQDQPR